MLAEKVQRLPGRGHWSTLSCYAGMEIAADIHKQFDWNKANIGLKQI